MHERANKKVKYKKKSSPAGASITKTEVKSRSRDRKIITSATTSTGKFIVTRNLRTGEMTTHHEPKTIAGAPMLHRPPYRRPGPKPEKEAPDSKEKSRLMLQSATFIPKNP